MGVFGRSLSSARTETALAVRNLASGRVPRSTRGRAAKIRSPGDWLAANRPNLETAFQTRFAARPRIGPSGPSARRMNRELASRSRIASRQAGVQAGDSADAGGNRRPSRRLALPPRAWLRRPSGVDGKSGSIEPGKPKMSKTRRFGLRKRRKSI